MFAVLLGLGGLSLLLSLILWPLFFVSIPATFLIGVGWVFYGLTGSASTCRPAPGRT